MTDSTLGRGAAEVEKGRLRFFAKVTGQRAPTFRFRLNGEMGDAEQMPRTVDLDRSLFLDARVSIFIENTATPRCTSGSARGHAKLPVARSARRACSTQPCAPT